MTLACADGATIDAHKVILSSVSTYFREILKVEMCYSDLFPRFHVLFSECPLQASNNHPEGHLQGGGTGHAGVCLHRGGQ